jgi:hypothetical protein
MNPGSSLSTILHKLKPLKIGRSIVKPIIIYVIYAHAKQIRLSMKGFAD